MADSTPATAAQRRAMRYEELVQLAIEQHPDWTWTACIVCGAEPVRCGVMLVNGADTLGLVRVGWCDKPECVADQLRSQPVWP